MDRTRLLNQATDLLLEAISPLGALDTQTRGRVRRALALVLEAARADDVVALTDSDSETRKSGLPPFLHRSHFDEGGSEDEAGA